MSELGKTVGQLLVNNLSVTIIVILWLLGGLFKITKKEINPLGWLSSIVGKAITKDVRKDVSDLKKDYNEKISAFRNDLDDFEKRTSNDILDIKQGTANNCAMLKNRLDEMEASQQKSNDMQTVQTIRSHILDFANSCFNKKRHTKQEFENIIDENTRYEELVKKYGIKNNVYKEDYDFILKIYHKCQEEGSFLKEGD